MLIVPSGAIWPAVVSGGGGPTFATWDAGSKGANITLSGGNLVATGTASLHSCRSNIGKTSGKWYWEYTVTTDNASSEFLGIVDTGFSSTTYVGNVANSLSMQPSGSQYNNGYTAGSGAGFAYTQGDVFGIALDMDNGKIWWHKNGTYGGSDPTGSDAYHGITGTVYAGISPYDATITANFGASAFGYSVPAGFNSGLYT